MATSLESYAPFDSGSGSNVTEAQWRNFMKYNQGGSGVYRGILNSFQPYADSTGMQIKVRTGECWIRGHWGIKTTETTLPIATAHATLARKDRVVLRADFDNNRVELDIKTGTASGSPVMPTLTQNTSVWETSLGYVDVPATDTSIDASQVTSFTHWTGAFGKFRRDTATTQTLATNTVAKIQFPTTINSTADLLVSGTNNTDFTIDRVGEWTISASMRYETLSSDFDGTRWMMITNSDASLRYTSVSVRPDPTDAALGCGLNASVTERLAAGTVICVHAYQNSGSTQSIAPIDGIGPVHVTFRWNGW